jgi:hypothetical protein
VKISNEAFEAADSICNYCSTRFPTDQPVCDLLDKPWFAEKVQIAIDKVVTEKLAAMWRAELSHVRIAHD